MSVNSYQSVQSNARLFLTAILTAGVCAQSLAGVAGKEPSAYKEPSANGEPSSDKKLTTFINIEPIQSANRTSYIRSLGLPTAENGQWFNTNSKRLSLTAELTSQFYVGSVGQESIFLDGETSTATLRYRHTISGNIEWGFDLPYIWQDGGSLDSFVEGWHRAFGLPNANREDYPRNEIHYLVEGPNADSNNRNIQLHQHSHGIGDIAASLRWHFGTKSLTESRALHLRIDAPTGNVEHFTGSDSWDVALGITAYSAKWFSALGAHFNGNIGVLFPGANDQLSIAMKDQVFYGSVTMTRPMLWDGFTVQLQLEAHSAFYESSLKPLGDSSWQLSFGGNLALSPQWALSLAMSEDISPHTAPDFTWLATLSYRP